MANTTSSGGGPQVSQPAGQSRATPGTAGNADGKLSFASLATAGSATSALIADWLLFCELVPDGHSKIEIAGVLALAGVVFSGAASKDPQSGLKLIGSMLWIAAILMGSAVLVKELVVKQARAYAATAQVQTPPVTPNINTWPQVEVGPDPTEVVHLAPGNYKLEFDSRKTFMVTTTGMVGSTRLELRRIEPNVGRSVSWLTIKVDTENSWLIMKSENQERFKVGYRVIRI